MTYSELEDFIIKNNFTMCDCICDWVWLYGVDYGVPVYLNDYGIELGTNEFSFERGEPLAYSFHSNNTIIFEDGRDCTKIIFYN